ncbi:hypothetical protein VP01_12033g1, partial [Puccinia sorghi]
ASSHSCSSAIKIINMSSTTCLTFFMHKILCELLTTNNTSPHEKQTEMYPTSKIQLHQTTPSPINHTNHTLLTLQPSQPSIFSTSNFPCKIHGVSKPLARYFCDSCLLPSDGKIAFPRSKTLQIMYGLLMSDRSLMEEPFRIVFTSCYLNQRWAHYATCSVA